MLGWHAPEVYLRVATVPWQATPNHAGLERKAGTEGEKNKQTKQHVKKAAQATCSTSNQRGFKSSHW